MKKLLIMAFLVIGCERTEDCGCSDPTACNYDSTASKSCNNNEISYYPDNYNCLYSDCNGDCTCYNTSFNPYLSDSYGNCMRIDCEGVCGGNGRTNLCGLCADSYENIEGCNENDLSIIQNWLGCSGDECFGYFNNYNAVCPYYENNSFDGIWTNYWVSWENGRISSISITCLINSIPENIGDLTELQYLELNYNKISTIPESIGQLKKLNYLDLSYNDIESLPDSIGQLESLYELNLSHNKISTIPESIGLLENISMFNVSYNEIFSLPESIGTIGQLAYYGDINMSYNHITTLPESINDLYFNHLYLNNNIIDSIPSFISFKNISHVNLNSNNLTFIEENICPIKEDNNYQYILINDNRLCNKYFFDCLNLSEWGIQDQSNCCVGDNGKINWLECP